MGPRPLTVKNGNKTGYIPIRATTLRRRISNTNIYNREPRKNPNKVEFRSVRKEELTEQKTRYVTALDHNFKGYDSYFVVKRLIERKQKFKPMRVGGKLLELTCKDGYIRLIDSM